MSKKTLFILFLLGSILILFGQNFELVPKSRLMIPPSEKRNLLTFIDRFPSSIEIKSKSYLKYFLLNKGQPNLNGQDMNLKTLPQKLAENGIENYLSDDDFSQTELGKTLKNIEMKATPEFAVWKKSKKKTDRYKQFKQYGYVKDDDLEEEEEKKLTLSANRYKALVNWKSSAIETSCGYSLQNQKIDLMFQNSFGVDYDPRLEASSVKMQLNW